jgi:hypothetical protein
MRNEHAKLLDLKKNGTLKAFRGDKLAVSDGSYIEAVGDDSYNNGYICDSCVFAGDGVDGVDCYEMPCKSVIWVHRPIPAKKALYQAVINACEAADVSPPLEVKRFFEDLKEK